MENAEYPLRALAIQPWSLSKEPQSHRSPGQIHTLIYMPCQHFTPSMSKTKLLPFLPNLASSLNFFHYGYSISQGTSASPLTWAYVAEDISCCSGLFFIAPITTLAFPFQYWHFPPSYFCSHYFFWLQSPPLHFLNSTYPLRSSGNAICFLKLFLILYRISHTIVLTLRIWHHFQKQERILIFF